ncbi:tetratricopeptide repeat protein [Saccharothrix luteola]|uniref:tetratricopeptide repeat protein n=1 Tax=Saccharothrix luteola TaxID=2893018 RepID=UPI001E61A462|nr:toll/interleukin-1 receptor domain-containing protein [Saccharothrix luteola]MCC8245496.1 toll/interleukin-1 receptor domain-containing protein [Saccharothrix luteola]
MGDGAKATWDVFLSYSWSEYDLALRVERALGRGGLRVFRDEKDVREFQPITEELLAALDSSKVLLALYSRRYPTRYACQWELTRAFVAGQRLGDPRDRVLVVNVGHDEGHVQPIELQDAVHLSARGGHVDLDRLVARAREKVVAVSEPIGAGSGVDTTPLPARMHRPRRFVGRYPSMWQVHSALQAKNRRGVHAPTAASAVVVKGFTGTGKSWLAEQYAFLFHSAYPGGVHWIDLGGAQDVHGEFVSALRRTADDAWGLNLDGVEPDRVVSAVVRRLNDAREDTLWVVDDVPAGLDASVLHRLVIGSPYAHVVITTQEVVPTWGGPVVELPGLTDVEAEELFRPDWGDLDEHQRAALSRMVRRCGGHPLVLSATAVDLRTDVSGGHDRFTQRLDAVAVTVVDALRSRVRGVGATARTVLAAAAVLSEAPFEVALVERALAVDVPMALAELEDGSLVQRLDRVGVRGGTRSWRVHALVAEAVRREVPAEEFGAHAVRLADVLPDFLSSADAHRHARVLADHSAVSTRQRAVLLRAVAEFHSSHGDVVLAEEAATALVTVGAEARVDDLLLAGRTALGAGLYGVAGDRAASALELAKHDDNFRAAYRARFLLSRVHEQAGHYDDADEVFPPGRVPSWLPEHEAHLVRLGEVTRLRLRGAIREAKNEVVELLPLLPHDRLPTGPWPAAMIERTRLELALSEIVEARRTSGRLLAALAEVGATEHPAYLEATALDAEAQLQVALTEGGMREEEWDQAAKKVSALHADHVRRLGPDNPLTLQFAVAECLAMVNRGQPDVVRALTDDVLPRIDRVLGRDHTLYQRAEYGRAQALLQLGKTGEARDLLADLLPRRVATIGRDHLDTLVTRLDLGFAMILEGDEVTGRPHVFEAARNLHRQYGWFHEPAFRAKVTTLYGLLPRRVLVVLLAFVRLLDRKREP